VLRIALDGDESPASLLRMTSQCFCMNRTPGRDGCIAMR
jgi:hypothetical protein